MNSTIPIVYVVDDDASFLRAISRLLRAGGYEIRTFSSVAAFLGDLPPAPVGCVVTDLRMPGTGGLELQSTMAAMEEPLPMVFLTGHGDIPTSVTAIRRGAEDFLTKPVRREELIAAIERAMNRGARERAERARKRAVRCRFDSVTPREREVIVHLVRGRLNKEIAAELGTTERTVKAHRANVMMKLGVDSFAGLVRLAKDSGLFDEA